MPTAPNGEPVTIGQIRRAGDFANGMNNKDVLPELEGKELSEQVRLTWRITLLSGVPAPSYPCPQP